MLLQVWDFATCTAEQVMTGHGGDINAAHWHPQHALVASGRCWTTISVEWGAKALVSNSCNCLCAVQSAWVQSGAGSRLWRDSVSRDPQEARSRVWKLV